MAGAPQRMHEVPYSRINEDDQVESGILDALHLHDGVWTIVEFKTDKVPDLAGLNGLIEREGYSGQAERYRQAVERLLGQRPQVILCFLDCGGAIHLHHLS